MLANLKRKKKIFTTICSTNVLLDLVKDDLSPIPLILTRRKNILQKGKPAIMPNFSSLLIKVSAIVHLKVGRLFKITKISRKINCLIVNDSQIFVQEILEKVLNKLSLILMMRKVRLQETLKVTSFINMATKISVNQDHIKSSMKILVTK